MGLLQCGGMRRVFRWIPTAWLGFVVIRYADTALQSMRQPLNSGLDVPWALAWLVFLLAAALLSVRMSSTAACRFWAVLSVITALTLLTLSHTLAPGLIAVLVLLIAHGSGELILRRFALKPSPMLERFVITVPSGITVLALMQLVLAWSGHFNRTTSWLMMLALAIPAALGLHGSLTSRVKGNSAVHPLLVAPFAWILFLNMLWATAPEIMFDPLSVHLAVPRLYLDHGGIVDMKYFFHSYFAHLLDMVFGLCLALGGVAAGPIVAKLLILALGLIAAYGVFTIGKWLFSAEAGAFAALIFYSTPLVVWLSGTTYMDLAETCFILGSLMAFMRWFQSGETGWIVASGLVAGVAIGTKMHALTVLAPIPLAIAWYAAKRWHQPAVRQVLIYVLLALVVAGPWYAIIYDFTGNPFFPFMNRTFKSPQWPEENTKLNAEAFGIGTSPRSLTRLPFRLIWNSERFGEGLPRGGVGFALLLAFPLAFLCPIWSPRWRTPLFGILLSCVVVHLVLWAVSFQYGRYFIPVLPLLAVFGCGLFLAESPWAVRWHRVLLFLGVVVQLPISAMLFWNIPERFPLDHALGRETDEHFLNRALGGYAAARYLNEVIQPGEQVLGVGLENLRLYIKAPLQSLAEASLGQGLQPVGENTSPSEVAAILQQLGFRYAVTPLADLENPALYYRWLQPDFKRRYETEVYRDDQVAILKFCYDDCK